MVSVEERSYLGRCSRYFTDQIARKLCSAHVQAPCSKQAVLIREQTQESNMSENALFDHAAEIKVCTDFSTNQLALHVCTSHHMLNKQASYGTSMHMLTFG